MKELLAGLRGPDIGRARALASRVTRPRFALGQVVRDSHGEVGAIDAIYADLEAAEDGGVVSDRREWLRVQRHRPTTPQTEPWYSVILASGNILGGERDLHRVAKQRASKQPTKPTQAQQPKPARAKKPTKPVRAKKPTKPVRAKKPTKPVLAKSRRRKRRRG